MVFRFRIQDTFWLKCRGVPIWSSKSDILEPAMEMASVC